ncbi:MAG: hypothetical protein HRS57_03150 [Mycoplasmataceae bacterium]|nr:hypothetical protein [Mycoplasmataceae bacterium]
MDFNLEEFIEWAEEIKSYSIDKYYDIENLYNTILQKRSFSVATGESVPFKISQSSPFLIEFIRYGIISESGTSQLFTKFVFNLGPYKDMQLKKYFEGTLYEKYTIHNNTYDVKKLDKYLVESFDRDLEELKEWRSRNLGLKTNSLEIFRELNNFKMQINDLKKDIKQIKITHIAEAFGEATGIPWASFILKRFSPAIIKLSDKTKKMILKEGDYKTRLLESKNNREINKLNQK